MKIIKILFLGIVLVLLNIAYLGAQLPDTIFVKPSMAGPGGTLNVSIEVSIHSEDIGGIIATIGGLPALSTAEGEWSYTWSTGIGQPLADAATAALVDFDIDTETNKGLINVSIVGVDIDLQAQLGELGLGGITSKSGELITFSFNVPEDMELGTYELTAVEDGNQLMPWPITDPALTELPVVETNPVIIAEIPEDNTLRLDASATALSGGTLSLPVHIANKDTVGSGSFTVDYSPSVLTMTGVTAGARAGGMSFEYSVADAPALLAAAGDKQATVTFSGGEIPTGGLGELCTLEFTVASVGGGASASVVLGNEALKDKAGADLAVAASPQGTTELSFFYADTLAIDVQTGPAERDVPWEGSGIAEIIDGKLYLPIRLKNSVTVEALRFYVTENPSDKLSLAAEPVMTLTPTANWVTAASDSGSYVQVAAYAATTADGIPAGDQGVLAVVYDITLAEGETPGVGDPGIDVSFALAGVEVVNSTGELVGVEAVGATATIDWRVPASGESVGPGASLPKAFALAQNYPNPFNPSTTINYQIPEDAGNVSFTLSVYDIRGRLVKTLASGTKSAGSYTAFWDGTDSNGRQVSSGVYFYRFTSSKYSSTRKMILLK